MASRPAKISHLLCRVGEKIRVAVGGPLVRHQRLDGLVISLEQQHDSLGTSYGWWDVILSL